MESIPFDTTAQDNAKKDVDAMQKASQQAQRNKYIIAGAILAAVIIASVVGFLIWRRKHAADEEDLFDDDIINPPDIDDIDDNDATKAQNKIKFKPVELDQEENEDTHVENEIKKYAKDKPDQVADVIKAWLAEDER